MDNHILLENPKETIGEITTKILNQPRQIFYRSERVSCYRQYMHPMFRIMKMVTGSFSYTIGCNNEMQKITLLPGDTLFCSRYGLTMPEQCTNDYTMLTLVFFPQYIRFLISEIKFDEHGKKSETYYWHHTNLPPSQATWQVLHALNDTSKSTVNSDYLEDLIIFIFKYCNEQLKQDISVTLSKPLMTYRKIKTFMTENMHLPINRETVAEKLNINPSHISKLFHQFGDTNFNTFLKELRMELAIDLIKENIFTVDEIAQQCGFENTPYFISSFKKYYGVTPGKYLLK